MPTKLINTYLFVTMYKFDTPPSINHIYCCVMSNLVEQGFFAQFGLTKDKRMDQCGIHMCSQVVKEQSRVFTVS